METLGRTQSKRRRRSLSGDELSVGDARWSEAVAVSSLAFVEKVKSELGIKALHRELIS
jgi:hypothetical protein